MKSMDGTFDVTFTQQAIYNFNQICLYLSLYNEEVMPEFKKETDLIFMMLSVYPSMYQKVYDNIHVYRRAVLNNYIILYKFSERKKCIYIVDILLQKQNHSLICKEQDNLYMIQ